MKSTLRNSGLHVAIIMDGNGRWATARGMPRLAGHRAGADAVRRTVESCPSLGVSRLTLFAFSSDNWGRPRVEVDGLMRLLRSYVRREREALVENGVRVRVIGRRDRLPASVLRAVESAEAATAAGKALELRLAIDYSSRDAILAAADRSRGCPAADRASFARALAGAADRDAASPDVDLMIRTGGERRLSDFLLWESAYAELWFTERMWPDFGRADLEMALDSFRRRERRYGRIPTAAAG